MKGIGAVMDHENHFLSQEGIPSGFGIGLAQNLRALDKFASMSEKEKRAVVEGAKKQQSRDEMKSYIDNI